MRVVTIVVILGLELALALPQYNEQEKGLHNELKQVSHLDNEEPNQDTEVKQGPSFDAVKERGEDKLEENRNYNINDAVKGMGKLRNGEMVTHLGEEGRPILEAEHGNGSNRGKPNGASCETSKDCDSGYCDLNM